MKRNGSCTFEAVIESWGHANRHISVVTGLLQRYFFYCFSPVTLCNRLNIAESKVWCTFKAVLIAGARAIQTKTFILVPSFLLCSMRGFTSYNNVTKSKQTSLRK